MSDKTHKKIKKLLIGIVAGLITFSYNLVVICVMVELVGNALGFTIWAILAGIYNGYFSLNKYYDFFGI